MLIDVLNIKDFHNGTLNCGHASPVRAIQTAAADQLSSLLLLGKVEDDDNPVTFDLWTLALWLKQGELKDTFNRSSQRGAD